MKKIITIAVLLVSMVCASSITTYAYDAEMAGTISTTGAAALMGIEDAYEASVIARMTGRAGATSPYGAKGIAFEIIYSDLKNAFCNLKDGLKTTLSASSIDDLADLVTTNKSGDIMQLIQCKDGTSTTQVNNLISQVVGGKYSEAELVCTSELATLYNEKASAKGVSQVATDSGISTNTTSKIANKALGIAPSGAELLKATAKNSGIAAAIAACVSLAESIYNGNDIYTTTSGAVEDASISAVSVALASVSAAEIPALLTAMGASAVVANTTAAVVAIVVPVAGGYALYLLADECQFEEKLADGLEELTATLSMIYQNISTKITACEIPEKVISAWDTAKQSGAEIKDSVKSIGESVALTATATLNGIGTWFSGESN